MIDCVNLISEALQRLDKLEVGKALDIRPYKKDRKIVIQKLEATYNIYEDGFEHETYLDVAPSELGKLLKRLGKIEFPRSNKLWMMVVEGGKV